jgi:hypothetical protein
MKIINGYFLMVTDRRNLLMDTLKWRLLMDIFLMRTAGRCLSACCADQLLAIDRRNLLMDTF